MNNKTKLFITLGAVAASVAGTAVLLRPTANIRSQAGEVLKTITLDGTHNVVPDENVDEYFTQTLYNDEGDEVGTYGYRFEGYLEDECHFGGDAYFRGTQYSGCGWRPSFDFAVKGLRKIEWDFSKDVPAEMHFYFDCGISSINEYKDTYTAPAKGSRVFDTETSAFSTSQKMFLFFPTGEEFTINSITLTYSYSECLGD